MPQNNIHIPKSKIINYCRQHHIIELAFFGSVLTKDFGPDSDIDVLITLDPDCHYSFYDVIDIRDDLKKMLGYEIDLVEKQGLKNPFRKHQILNNMEVIYAA
ncbi:MAG: nucleotidyltransferase domain-containing protein [Phycisphaerae bacterium]|nr:nucleotidyltransferase domain-containing protein [Phycisphaerae bacterium]